MSSRSLNGLKCLKRDILKFVRVGFLRKLRPELPKVRPRGAVNAPGLSRRGPTLLPPGATNGLPVLALPTTSAYEPTPRPSPTPALSAAPVPLEPPPLITLKGVPV